MQAALDNLTPGVVIITVTGFAVPRPPQRYALVVQVSLAPYEAQIAVGARQPLQCSLTYDREVSSLRPDGLLGQEMELNSVMCLSRLG